MSGWNILACGDMVMPMSSNGVTDMFRPIPWSSTAYNAWCNVTYGIQPNYNWAI